VGPVEQWIALPNVAAR